jgi:signal transduction histidine kinase
VDCARLLSRVVAREARGRPGGEVKVADLSGLPSVVGDEEMLERAFENVVRNAREAAGVGGLVSVRAEASHDGDLRVIVADDGPGLPPERSRIPRPFFTTKPGGLGLGLPMAVKVVKLHGGHLILHDAVPHGLEVEIRLPSRGPG